MNATDMDLAAFLDSLGDEADVSAALASPTARDDTPSGRWSLGSDIDWTLAASPTAEYAPAAAPAALSAPAPVQPTTLPVNDHQQVPSFITNAPDVVAPKPSKAVISSMVITVAPEMTIIDTQRERMGIKPCTCKKSKCKKHYCECFHAGVPCGSRCQCIGCCNTTFRTDATGVKARDSCTCTKTRCLKKYCECYAASRPCGAACSCVNCANTHQQEPSFYKRSSQARLPQPRRKRPRVAEL